MQVLNLVCMHGLLTRVRLRTWHLIPVAFQSTVQSQTRQCQDADGYAGVVEGIGTVSVIFHGYAITLCDVLCVPSLSENLFSVTAAASRGTQLMFNDSGAFVFCDHESFQVQRDTRSGLVVLVDTL
jgi:hypothetical protein